jgi:hypothetical protein
MPIRPRSTPPFLNPQQPHYSKGPRPLHGLVVANGCASEVIGERSLTWCVHEHRANPTPTQTHFAQREFGSRNEDREPKEEFPIMKGN